MPASVGDRITLHAKTAGEAPKTAEIIEVRGADGNPPYLVRFEDGHEGLVFPGPDDQIENASEA
ncbi:hypothetical protein N7540_009994 [Penicillium herquei]|nr:hypothetical protein N7540_009994 [Penicillium herquei]